MQSKQIQWPHQDLLELPGEMYDEEDYRLPLQPPEFRMKKVSVQVGDYVVICKPKKKPRSDASLQWPHEMDVLHHRVVKVEKFLGGKKKFIEVSGYKVDKRWLYPLPSGSQLVIPLTGVEIEDIEE